LAESIVRGRLTTIELEVSFISKKLIPVKITPWESIQAINPLPISHFLTFDVDCLDPAFAPGTGTPVVGGLFPDLALKIIRG